MFFLIKDLHIHDEFSLKIIIRIYTYCSSSVDVDEKVPHLMFCCETGIKHDFSGQNPRLELTGIFFPASVSWYVQLRTLYRVTCINIAVGYNWGLQKQMIWGHNKLQKQTCQNKQKSANDIK